MASHRELVTDVGVTRALTVEQRRRAVRVAAACATDAEDLRTVLDMLGLSPVDGWPGEDRVDEGGTAGRHGLSAADLAELAALREEAQRHDPVRRARLRKAIARRLRST